VSMQILLWLYNFIARTSKWIQTVLLLENLRMLFLHGASLNYLRRLFRHRMSLFFKVTLNETLSNRIRSCTHQIFVSLVWLLMTWLSIVYCKRWFHLILRPRRTSLRETCIGIKFVHGTIVLARRLECALWTATVVEKCSFNAVLSNWFLQCKLFQIWLRTFGIGHRRHVEGRTFISELQSLF
jgi:hypothetical protein